MSNILIICPEITKGMKSIGSKSLLGIKKNLTLIEYQVAQLQKIKPSSITLSIGFDAEKIKQKLSRYRSLKYIINREYETTNQGKNLIEYLHYYNPDSLLIVSSGLLIKNNIISKKYLKNNSKIFILNKPKNNFFVGCSRIDKVEYLFYDMPEAWSEMVYLDKKAIDLLKSQEKNLFSQMYLFEIINFLLQKHILFDKIYVQKNDIMKINNIKDVITAKSFI